MTSARQHLDDDRRARRLGWMNVVIAAVVMLATLPGRTQGLGLITEPLLADAHLDRVVYATINLWATLIGAAFCIPAGWLLDYFGLRWATATVVVLLSVVVWSMSLPGGGVALLFVLILLTRALGQSALSVASITAVGKSFGQRIGLPMGVYAVLLSVLFIIAFILIGDTVRSAGWRVAWEGIALALVLGVLPLVLLFLRDPPTATTDTAAIPSGGLALTAALRTGAFWIFAGATSLYGLVASGLGLFNEAVLAERGFDQQTYHHFLAITTLVALIGQLLCAWLSLRWPLQRLLAIALLAQALALIAIPLLSTLTHLWLAAALMGLSGGMITVLFFAIWGPTFGRLHLGRIQGAAQMLTVLASAIGPLLFAQCHAAFQSYAPVLWTLAPAVALIAIAALRVRLPVAEPETPAPLRMQPA